MFSQQELSQSKEVQYREVDFTSPRESQAYLDNIHHSQTSDTNELGAEIKLLYQAKDYFLFTHQNALFLGSKEALVNFHIRSLLSEIDKEQISPLLISRPLDFKRVLSKKELTQAESLGFELDPLDGETYAVRSFYFPLQVYPYLSLLELIVREKFDWFKINFYQEMSSYNPSDHAVSDLLSQISFHQLLEQKLIRPIDSKLLGKWYED